MKATREDIVHDPSSWVELHGDALYRFAILRIKDPHVAEDLVQETFLSALQGLERFKGGSSLRTWLIGILKHKIIDHFRKTSKEVLATDLNPWDEEDERELYDETGHYKTPMFEWKGSPHDLVENKQFWKVFHTCLSGLPEAHRRAFTLREVDGVKSEEICKILSITPTNLWVMLHRSRARLRKCLDSNWFRANAKEAE
ncbi:MAG: sigma-70 family RNA polymerase sigma factor [Candidatus Latescibacteria bacterium]|nr:sigma-70 family RNA polymerase sigma factor [Candidatus Latescibacterota bacterium]NIM21733.1 sigma-70 family RNA polymerase sigma factor [Candidatus Latescibacterota bacterium]NIM65871.1 sigma-70 family RNA polymerase sigma factor [Candidatus Latescibacterota bacterium]NIO02616.1 sigma-70 family RNA polymerase sigma factor [Candidatus Latescibacterota bacterium]NIO29597.1 sigma-70 family RNA polymerase sigma factor [Candidatus Latescibacterota bacterium]